MATVARVLSALSLLHVLLWLVPPPTWTLWMLRFAAMESAPIAALTGLAALLLTSETTVRALGAVGVVFGLLPIVLSSPAYARERAPFSVARWFGAREPEARREVDVVLAEGLVADVYRPATPGPHPYVVIVHGGSWRSGDKGDVPHVSNALANAGYAVIDFRYRLDPFPAAVEDVRRALVALRDRAAALELDPNRAALLGRSAGGQVALLAAYAPPEAFAPAAPPVRAVISIYAPTDLAWDHENPYFPDVVDGTAALEQYLGGPPGAAADAYRRATPMTWLDAPVPPTLLVHGASERCVRPENTERLRDALAAKGNTVRTLFVPFADHGFDVRRGGIGEQLARHVILDFLKEQLGGR